MALRAARRVTATSRSVGRLVQRTALRTALTVALATAPLGCGSDSPAGSTGAAFDSSVVDALASNPDTAALLTDILDPSTDTGQSEGTDDIVAIEDTPPVADLATAEDEGPPVDTGPTEDLGSADDVVTIGDAGSTGMDAAPTPDVSGGPIDPADGTCLFPTGNACTANFQPTGATCETAADCADWTGADMVCTADGKCEMYTCEAGAEVCYDGSCHAGQGHQDETLSKLADTCCIEIWESPDPPLGAVPGCTPWGPPAPPIDRGYRLSQLLGIA